MAEAYYEPTPATDGATMNPVPGAVFQVFEIADTAFATPLSLRVGSGNPTTTVTASDTLATLPGVYVTSPNFEHIWKSGTFEWRRDSIDGAKKAIEDAKIAASNSASASDASAVSAANSAQAAQDAAALVDAPADQIMADTAANPTTAFAGVLSATYALKGDVPTGTVTSASVARIIAVAEGDPLPALNDGDMVIRYTPPGANYYTDFSGYTTGVAPSDWSLPWISSTGIVIVDDAAATGGKALQQTEAGTGRRAITWNAIDTDAERANVEVLFKWKTGTTINPPAAILRASGAAATEQGYWLGGFNATQKHLGKYVGGTFTNITNIAAAFAASTWYLTRARVNGTTVQQKTWLATDPEPASWDSTATDSSISAAGKVGVFNGSNGVRTIDWFAVATGGRTAAQP